MINELSIIFPIYNEQKRLKKAFAEILKFKRFFNKKKLEIVFSDDGSSDKSQKLIEEFVKKNSNKLLLKKILSSTNRGKGHALKLGINLATKKWILTSDLDLSVPLNQIISWKKKNLIKENNIIFGSRNVKNSIVKANILRMLLGKIFNFLVKNLLDISLKDTQCGFKLYRRSHAKKIFKELNSRGFSHDLEIVLLSKKRKIKIIELPVKWEHKKGSKLNIFLEPVKMFLNILILKIKY